MVSKCPKCSRNVPEDAVYCPYCAHGIQPSAKTTNVSAAGTLMIVAGVAGLIFFVISIRALLQIYTWYLPGVAQGWLVYDQALTMFSLVSFVFGFSAGVLSLARRSYRWTMMSAIFCTFSGGGVWIISMIIPFAYAWTSLLYYFLPMFATALIGTVLIYPRKAEFKQ